MQNCKIALSQNSTNTSIFSGCECLRATGWRLGVSGGLSQHILIPHFPPPLRQTARYLLAFFYTYFT